jgi:hypothetical protein
LMMHGTMNVKFIYNTSIKTLYMFLAVRLKIFHSVSNANILFAVGFVL